MREREFRFPPQTGVEELRWGHVVPAQQEQEWLLQQAGFGVDMQRSLLGEGFTLLVTREPS